MKSWIFELLFHLLLKWILFYLEDGNPVEFLVDFTAKAREDECRRIEEEEKAKAEKSEAVHFVANEGMNLCQILHDWVIHHYYSSPLDWSSNVPGQNLYLHYFNFNVYFPNKVLTILLAESNVFSYVYFFLILPSFCFFWSFRHDFNLIFWTSFITCKVELPDFRV